jgi:hypothetical protein
MAMVDLSLAALRIRIFGYQYPRLDDYWDGNWLVVDAKCSWNGQSASIKGDACLRTTELHGFVEGLTALQAGQTDEAHLDTMEPYMDLKVQRNGDELSATASIKESSIEGAYVMTFPVDGADVLKLRNDVKTALDAFPVHGSEE